MVHASAALATTAHPATSSARVAPPTRAMGEVPSTPRHVPLVHCEASHSCAPLLLVLLVLVAGSCDALGQCVCQLGYYGAECAGVCPGGATSPCSGHGNCDPTAGTCNCNPGYFGNDCNSECPKAADGSICNDHGTCNPSTGKCKCEYVCVLRVCVSHVRVCARLVVQLAHPTAQRLHHLPPTAAPGTLVRPVTPWSVPTTATATGLAMLKASAAATLRQGGEASTAPSRRPGQLLEWHSSLYVCLRCTVAPTPFSQPLLVPRPSLPLVPVYTAHLSCSRGYRHHLLECLPWR